MAAYDGLVYLGGRPRFAAGAADVVASVIVWKDRIEHLLYLRDCQQLSNKFYRTLNPINGRTDVATHLRVVLCYIVNGVVESEKYLVLRSDDDDLSVRKGFIVSCKKLGLIKIKYYLMCGGVSYRHQQPSLET